MIKLASIFQNVDPNQDGLNAIFPLLANLINIAMFAAGALSIIFVVVGGLRYAASAGNPQATAAAKKTIFYAVGGLALAVMGLVIVRFANGIFS